MILREFQPNLSGKRRSHRRLVESFVLLQTIFEFLRIKIFDWLKIFIFFVFCQICLYIFQKCIFILKYFYKIYTYREYDNNGVREYSGAWLQGKRTGQGILFDDQGVKLYEGSFLNGKKEGFGINFFEDGRKLFEGNWKDNLTYYTLKNLEFDVAKSNVRVYF